MMREDIWKFRAVFSLHSQLIFGHPGAQSPNLPELHFGFLTNSQLKPNFSHHHSPQKDASEARQSQILVEKAFFNPWLECARPVGPPKPPLITHPGPSLRNPLSRLLSRNFVKGESESKNSEIWRIPACHGPRSRVMVPRSLAMNPRAHEWEEKKVKCNQQMQISTLSFLLLPFLFFEICVFARHEKTGKQWKLGGRKKEGICITAVCPRFLCKDNNNASECV